MSPCIFCDILVCFGQWKLCISIIGLRLLFFLHTRSFNTGKWVGTIWNAKLTLQATCLTGQGRNWHHSEAWASSSTKLVAHDSQELFFRAQLLSSAQEAVTTEASQPKHGTQSVAPRCIQTSSPSLNLPTTNPGSLHFFLWVG